MEKKPKISLDTFDILRLLKNPTVIEEVQAFARQTHNLDLFDDCIKLKRFLKNNKVEKTLTQAS